uniref:Jun dimerization protein 2 n=3 Tax=Equus TaxID=9789 RepID=A0A9L0RWV4_HORSE
MILHSGLVSERPPFEGGLHSFCIDISWTPGGETKRAGTGIQEQLCTNVLLTRLLRSQDCAHLSSRFSVPWAHSRWSTSDGWMDGWTAAPPAMMPGQIPDPSVTAGSLPGLGPLTGLPSSALTVEELKYADIRNIGAMIAPLHFLEVKLGKRPQPVKSELDEEEERRKRRREKNKVAAARCRNKKKERTEFLQRESERLELMNAELKTQIEELKQERQQLILMLNRHRPTCIVRTDSVKTPESEGNPLLEQLEKK